LIENGSVIRTDFTRDLLLHFTRASSRFRRRIFAYLSSSPRLDDFENGFFHLHSK